MKQQSKFFKASWNHYKRLKKLKLGRTSILEKSSKVTTEFERSCTQPALINIKKRRKSFESLGPKWQKERTDALLRQINMFVDQECPELSVTQLLGYLIHRVNIQSEKKVAKIGHDIFTASLGAKIVSD